MNCFIFAIEKQFFLKEYIFLQMQSDSQRKKITEDILRKKDPHIIDIVHSCDHVVLYKHVNDIWKNTDTEGAMHIVKRNVSPFFQLIILNKKNPQNFYYDFTPNQVNIDEQLPYIIFRNNQSSDIYGLWFYNKLFGITFLEVFNKLNFQQNQFQIQPFHPFHMASIQGPFSGPIQGPIHPIHPIPIPQTNPMQPIPFQQPQSLHSDILTNLLKNELNIQNQSTVDNNDKSQSSVSTDPNTSQEKLKDDKQSLQHLKNQQNKSIDTNSKKDIVQGNNEKTQNPKNQAKNKIQLKETKNIQDKEDIKKQTKNSKKKNGKNDISEKEEPKNPTKIIKRNQNISSSYSDADKNIESQINKNGSDKKEQIKNSDDKKPEIKPSSDNLLKLLPPQFITSELKKLKPENGSKQLETIETKEEFRSFLIEIISNEKETQFFDNLYRHFMLSRKFGDKF